MTFWINSAAAQISTKAEADYWLSTPAYIEWIDKSWKDGPFDVWSLADDDPMSEHGGFVLKDHRGNKKAWGTRLWCTALADALNYKKALSIMTSGTKAQEAG